MADIEPNTELPPFVPFPAAPAALAPPPPADPAFGLAILPETVPPSLPCDGLTGGVFPEPPLKSAKFAPPPPEPPSPALTAL